MNPQTKQHYVIIVHYNNPAQTHELVNNLLTGAKSPDSVVVIDNGNNFFITPGFDNCQVIKPRKNVGYAAGINMGLGALSAQGIKADDVITCMNNDIIIDRHVFVQVRRWWERHPAVALVGFSTIKESAWGQVNLLTGRAQLVPAPTSRDKLAFWQLPYINGALLSAPLSVWANVQGMPAKYFMYWEDVLLSQRVRLKQVPLRVAVVSQAVHRAKARAGQEAANTADKLYYLVRNGALFLAHETPLPWRWYWLLVNRLRYIYHVLLRTGKPTVAQAMRDAINQVVGPREKN